MRIARDNTANITGVEMAKSLRAHSLLAVPALIVMSGEARAQSIAAPSAPIRSSVDERGVDLLTGNLYLDDKQLSIGAGQNRMALIRHWRGSCCWIDNNYMVAGVAANGSTAAVEIDRSLHTFSLVSGVLTSDQRDGSTISYDASSITFTDKNGSIYLFDRTIVANSASYKGSAGAVGTQITRPDGAKTYLTYKRSSYVSAGATFFVVRLQSVKNSFGYQFKYSYADNTLSSTTVDDWARISDVAAINNAVDYCDPTADSCSFTQSWPHVAYGMGGNVETVTDPELRTKSFTTSLSYGNTLLVSSRSPGFASDNVTYGYDTQYRVTGVTQAGYSAPWGYTYSGNYSQTTVSVTTPSIPTPRVALVYNRSLLISVTDENNNKITYGYDGFSRLNGYYLPEATTAYGSVAWIMDSRGNTTQMIRRKKDGTAPIYTYATYPGTCTTLTTCNKPITSTDANGNITNYYYNPDGSPDYIQTPVPTAGAARPEVHYAYAPKQAWFKDASGNVVASADAVTMLTGASTCATGTWPCAASNQVVTSFSYYGGPTATNLLIQSITTASGTGTPSSTTSYAYDSIGNRTTDTDPNLAATTSTYNANRELTSVTGPDPDGPGPRLRRSKVQHYAATGLIDSIAVGTVNGGGAFSASQYLFTTYDSANRKIADRVSDGTVDYALTQYSYDGAGRLQCSAIRMTVSAYGALPDACTQSTSADTDRITKVDYENAGQPSTVYTGVGTPLLRSEAHYTHTPDGLLQTLTDAMGNVTTYEYDGYDQLSKTRFPNPAGGGSSTTDYEQLLYDPNGNVTSRALRGGSTIGYGYDGLDRVTTKTFSSGETGATYSYDLLGHPLTATQNTTLTYTWDALGRMTSETQPFGSLTYQYDPAGNRTRTTWQDGFFTMSSYDNAGQLTAISENGSIALATFTYDDLGRRVTMTRGNGITTAYGYDTVSQMTSLTNGAVGAPDYQNVTFAHDASGKISWMTRSNPNYAFSGYVAVNRPYVTNGLNQYTSAGSATFTYDGLGNLATSGSTTYGYTSENQLKNSSSGISFFYDPAGRLTEYDTSVPTRFMYDGGQIAAEVSNITGAVTKRYVFGPGSDEPLVEYDSSGVKTYLVADERGSIVTRTDTAGATIARNSYDEYGIPDSANVGRFQYTGQAWLSELGMAYYKARMYSPTLGRFLQADPSGYGDGLNLYNYVNGDPVNGIDPTGLETRCAPVGLECTYTQPEPSQPRGENNGPAPGYNFGPGVDFTGFDALSAIAQSALRARSSITSGPAPQSSNGCVAPPISSAERAAAARGDRSAFWRSRSAHGDPLAGTALSIVNNAFWGAGVVANLRLRNFINERTPGMTASAVSAEVQQIGVQLMQQHVAAIDKFGSPNTSQIADYHNQIFNSHGLPNSTFGGTMFGGAGITNFITGWAGCRL